jgi:hypothetical protein
MFVRLSASVEGRVVTGAPYSATSTTTLTQTLSNGTHIVQTQQTTLYRDSAGRTRREESVQNVGPWSTSQTPKSLVFINDPVARVHYVLEPDSQVASRVALPDASPASNALLAQKLEAEAGATKMVVTSGVSSAEVPAGATTQALSPIIVSDRMVESDKDAKVDTLPDQVMEGVTVHGKRTTSTIPAGTMGNDQPIVTTTETWYSPDLQMVVMSKRSDPRVGDTVTALTGISRSEPAPSLFQLPTGYTVVKDLSAITFDYNGGGPIQQ